MQSDNSISSEAAGPTRLFASSGPESLQSCRWDADGFLKANPLAFDFKRLFDTPCTLVVAPPWLGKTTVAKGIHRYLAQTGGKLDDDLDFADWFTLTSFEEHIAGAPLEPPWWDTWAGQESGTCCWIVDALDEAKYLETRWLNHLLSRLEDLPPDRRSRIRLLLLGRRAEIPKEVFEKLQEIYGEDHRIVDLLPLDRQNAEEILGVEPLKRVLDIIRRCGGLRHLAGYPAVISYLSKQDEDAQITEVDAWRGVLLKLLEDPDPSRRERQKREPEERFGAAAHLAAVLTFSGTEEITKEDVSLAGRGRSLLDLMPLNSALNRAAAREALQSGMFWTTPNGSRFIQRNVREWMSAFGARDLPLARLRPLLGEGSDAAELVPRHFHDLAILLRKTTQVPEVRAWLAEASPGLPSDAAPPSFEEAESLLAHLESLATSSGWDGGFEEDSLARLETPGLGAEIARRFANPESHPAARKLMLRIAVAVGATELAPEAARIVQDSTEDIPIRSWSASYLLGIEDVGSLRTLIPFVQSAVPDSREEKEIISTLISAFLQNGIWSAPEAYRYLPIPTDKATIDRTSILPSEIAKRMTAIDALEILESIPPKGLMEVGRDAFSSRSPKPGARSRSEIIGTAVGKVLIYHSENPETLGRLIPFALTAHPGMGHELLSRLREAYKNHPEARRELFLAYVEEVESENGYVDRSWRWNALTTEDLQWLQDQLPVLASQADFVWSTFLHLAHSDSVSSKLRNRCRSFVGDHAPAALDDFDRGQDEYAKLAREEEEERAAEQRRPQRPLAEIDQEILAHEDLTPAHRLRHLAWFNFLEQAFRPRGVVGTWDDLPQELQTRILYACQKAIDQVEPTPITSGRTFTNDILCEAYAFVTLLQERPHGFQITSERIKKWLPAVLAAIHSSSQQNVLLACHRDDPTVTEEVLKAAIERELGQEGHYSVILQNLPRELWTPELSNWIADWIQSQRIPNGAQPRLLGLLAARVPAKGEEVAHAIVDGSTPDELFGLNDGLPIVAPENHIGYRALDVLLALDPDTAWPLVHDGFEVLGGKLLENLKSLFGDAYGDLSVDFQAWPPERLADLVELLFRAYPPEEDPELHGAFAVTPDHLLRQLRLRLFELLYDRREPLLRRLEELREKYPRFGEWYIWHSADLEARSLLERPSEWTPVPTLDFPRPEYVAKLLIDSEYRLVRNGHDLLEVLVEELTLIDQDAKDDLPMLYYPKEKDSIPKRRHEDALQVYIRTRLRDRLRNKILERECEVKLKRRTDIKVLAQTAHGEKPAVVVIEVKWSDNREKTSGISTGLPKQLGQKYLIEEGEQYGIFAVGWNGKLGRWYDKTIPRPSRDPAALQEALSSQATTFQENHPGVEIRSVVLDLDPRKDLYARTDGSESPKSAEE